MLKTKKRKIFFIAIIIFSMVAVYGSVPSAKAANLTNAKDTISDSDIGATNVTHAITFTTAVPLVATDYMEVVFPAGFTGVDFNFTTCSDGMTASSTGQIVHCTAAGGVAAGARSISVASVDNPSPANGTAYTVAIATKNASGVIIENMDVMVYIISDVFVTAKVPSTLTFSISGLGSGVDVNGVQTTVVSTATTTPFGTLSTTASTTVGQQLAVTTNADDGFSVTVFEDSELTNGAGSNINSFNNSPTGTGSTTPGAWAAPLATLDVDHTYGHMGLTSEDSTLTGDADPFGTALYAGLNGTAKMEVMYNDGPAAGAVDGIGVTQVAYTVEISALQEAGDYQTYLTYICTPQY